MALSLSCSSKCGSRRRAPAAGLAALVWLLSCGIASAQGAQDVETLRRQLIEQQTLLRQQRELTERQQATLDQLTKQIEQLTARLAEIERSSATVAPSPTGPPQAVENRDAVGDLNAGVVAAGDFPGSFRIPGSQGVSLAFGGFVKAVAIADSAAEALGSNMLPSTLGSRRNDTAGNFAIDATLTRLHIDGRATTSSGALRAYVEYDLNGANDGSLGFKLRHAYGTWRTGAGTLTAGQTWSTLMDLRILPEGLTEPTVSGAIFNRQAQMRWSWPQTRGFAIHVAVEDPSGTDVFTNQALDTRSAVPDFVGGVEYDRPGIHFRGNTLVRRLELESSDTSVTASAVGWGWAGSGRFAVMGRDAAAFSVTYGTGSGRYVLGLSGGSAGIFDPGETRLRLRGGGGALAWYQHYWSASVRSTWAIGHARSEIFDAQPAEAFRSTTYTYGNLMWSVMRYASVGIEYDFGRRTTKDGSGHDNHRVMFGIQVF